jgi:hypothetical protein
MCTKFWLQNLKEKEHFGDLDVDEKIILLRVSLSWFLL